MKSPAYTLLSILFLFAQTLSAEVGDMVFSGFGDTSKLRYHNLHSITISDDLKSAQITPKREKGWEQILETEYSALKPNTRYTMSFKSKSPDGFDSSKKMELVIYADDNGNKRYIRKAVVYPSIKYRNFKFNFTSPDMPSKIVLTVLNGLRLDIADFSLREGYGEKIIPIDSEIAPKPGKKTHMPSGSADFTIDAPRGNGPVVDASDFGLSQESDKNASALNKAIEYCKKVGASKLTMPKGTYKIFEEVHINFKGLKDFVFDGNGSTLVYKKRKSRNMHIADCERVQFRNFNMDWDWDNDPLGSLVEVVGLSNTPGNSYIDYRFYEYDRFPNRNPRIAYLSPWDEKNASVGLEGARGVSYEMYRGKGKAKIEWLNGNTLRVKTSPEKFLFFFPKIGEKFRMQHNYYEMGGIRIDSNSHMLMENINIWSCAGQAVTVYGTQKYWEMKNFNILPPKGVPRRPLSSTADHLIFAQSAGFFKMENCDFGYGCDDCINFHDNTIFGVKISEDKIWLPHRRNLALYQAGSIIELRNDNYSATNYIGKIISVSPSKRKKNTVELTFDKPLPDPTGDCFILLNTAYGTKNIIVRNSKFHNNRARGILILASNVSIENCKFYRNEMGALKIETGFTYASWCEGFGAKNIVIRNCEFDSVNPGGAKTADGHERDIQIAAYLRLDPSFETTSQPLLSDILFDSNVFKNTYGLAAHISSARNVIFSNNTFINDAPRKSPLPYRAGFFVRNSDDITIINNKWVSSKIVVQPSLLYEPESVNGLRLYGNKVEPLSGDN